MHGTMRGRTPTAVQRQRVDEDAGHTYQWKCSFCDEDAAELVSRPGFDFRVPVCDSEECRRQLEIARPRPKPKPRPQKEIDVGPFDFKNDLTEEEVARWARWRRAGVSYAYVEEHGMGNPSYPTVKTYLKKYGYNYDGTRVDGEPEQEPAEEPAGTGKRYHDLITEEVAARFAEMRQAGESLATIAEENGMVECSGTVVGDYLQKFGYDRNTGEPKRKQKPAAEPAEEERQVETVQPEEEEAAPLATGNGTAVTEQNVDRQLAAVQQLMATLQAGSVQVSGRIRLELAVEVEL